MLSALPAIDQLSCSSFTPRLRPPTKLALGRRLPISPAREFPHADQVPFDPDALYGYLMAHAERRWIPATVQALATLFETEFPSGTVPESFLTDVADAMRQSGIADAAVHDDLRRVALVELFVSRYTWGYAHAPEQLLDPSTVRLTYADWLAAMAEHCTTWLHVHLPA